MNILVWSSWVGHPAGGQERVALELAIQLHQRKHRVVLAGAYENSPELRARIPSGLPFYHFDIHRHRLKRHLRLARLLQQLVREHQINVISAHGSIFAPHRVCRACNIPLVWTIHGAEPRATDFVGCLKTAAVGHVLAARTTYVVAVSQATAVIVGDRFPQFNPERLHVIHNGVIDASALAGLPLPQAGPPWKLGFVGRLAVRKRPLDLVPVAQFLKGRLNFQLHVFGDGPVGKQLHEAIQREGLQDQFVLHGYWNQGSAGMVEQFQVLVHTDDQEPFGGALLEAQWGGRPVAAYRAGGNPEIVEDGVTGRLVPPGDTGALAVAICEIAGEHFSKLAQAARDRAARHFTVARMTDQYISFFERACASH
jgi:glycosyltransferase involved in cell wall biosynthesis